MDIPAEMLAAKAALEGPLSFVPGVVGIDIGLREVNGDFTDELVIRIFVDDPANVPFQLQGLIAGTGFPVQITHRDFSPLADTARYETLFGGISIAAGHGPLWLQAGAGTLGGLAQDTMFPGPLVGVSCAHVIAESATESTQQGDPIFQPEGGQPNFRQIGQLLRWSEHVDCAVFAPSPGMPAQTRVEEVGPIAGMAEAKIDDLVFKRGRTTRLTWGRVTGKGLVLFHRNRGANGIEVTSHAANPPIFCDHGDSGSLVINQQYQVVGLLFRAGRTPTWGVGVPGYVSGFAVDIQAAAAAVGFAF